MLVACDRGARLAKLHGDRDLATTWRKAADEIHADICEHGLDERGVFVQHYETTALDASVLLMPLLRFPLSDDPRIRNTVLAIADELTMDELVLRYRVEETDDGFAGEEDLHHLLVLAGVGPGRDRRGRQGPAAVREAAVACQPAAAVRRGDRPALRPLPRQLPQAFTHSGLINAVSVHVVRAETGGDATRFRLRASPRCERLDLHAVAGRVGPIMCAAATACLVTACARSPQPDPPSSGPPMGEATSSSRAGAQRDPQPPSGPTTTGPPSPTTWPPVAWRVGARRCRCGLTGLGRCPPRPCCETGGCRPPTGCPRRPGRFRSAIRPISAAVRTGRRPGGPLVARSGWTTCYVTASRFHYRARTRELVVR